MKGKNSKSFRKWSVNGLALVYCDDPSFHWLGNPAPQVVWVGLGKPLEDDGYHRIYDRNGENYLEMPKISILDAGEYSCIATNMMGAVYSKFTICVEGIQWSSDRSVAPICVVSAMTEPESTSSEMEERSANVSDADANNVRD